MAGAVFPFSCARLPHLLGDLEIRHLSSVRITRRLRNLTPTIGSRGFEGRQGYGVMLLNHGRVTLFLFSQDQKPSPPHKKCYSWTLCSFIEELLLHRGYIVKLTAEKIKRARCAVGSLGGGVLLLNPSRCLRGVEHDVFAQYPVLPGVRRGCLLFASPHC